MSNMSAIKQQTEKTVRAVKKSAITNDLHSAGLKVPQSIAGGRFRVIAQDVNHQSVGRMGRPDWNLQRSKEMSHMSSGSQSHGRMRPIFI